MAERRRRKIEVARVAQNDHVRQRVPEHMDRQTPAQIFLPEFSKTPATLLAASGVPRTLTQSLA